MQVRAASCVLRTCELTCLVDCRGEEYDPPVWSLLVRCKGRVKWCLCAYSSITAQDGKTFHFLCDSQPFRFKKRESPQKPALQKPAPQKVEESPRKYVSRGIRSERPAPTSACLSLRAAPPKAVRPRSYALRRPAGFAAVRTPRAVPAMRCYLI